MPDADALSRQKAKVARADREAVQDSTKWSNPHRHHLFTLRQRPRPLITHQRSSLGFGILSPYLSFPQATCVYSRSRRVPMRSQEPCKLRLPNHPRAIISTEAQQSGETPAFRAYLSLMFVCHSKTELASAGTHVPIQRRGQHITGHKGTNLVYEAARKHSNARHILGLHFQLSTLLAAHLHRRPSQAKNCWYSHVGSG